jgi:hypothetical protein
VKDSGSVPSVVGVLDQDLGVSGSGLAERAGFTHITAEVALGHVGIVLGLEVSRLARNNADWHGLLDLCGTTDTLSAMLTASIIRGCSMIGWCSDSKAPGRRPNYMCCRARRVVERFLKLVESAERLGNRGCQLAGRFAAVPGLHALPVRAVIPVLCRVVEYHTRTGSCDDFLQRHLRVFGIDDQFI